MNSTSNHSWVKPVGHLAVWLLLLCLPIIFSSADGFDELRFLRYNLIPLTFHCIIFYSNYLQIIDRFLFTKKHLQFVLINLLLVLVAAYIVHQLKHYLATFAPAKSYKTGFRGEQYTHFFYKDLVSMLMPVVISIAARTTEKWSENETEKKEIEKENLKSELQHLKYQLQPHFFFNSLNTIYALVERSPELAQETIHNLSNLMRYMLYDTDKERVSLSDEIEFMKQYIGLMKLRISENVNVSTEFPENTKGINVAPLLFISLIENAFKHGISAGKSSEFFFAINIKDGAITFVAKNSNFPKSEDDQSGSGIGLVNLKKRLELSYPGKHKIISHGTDKDYQTLLEIQI